jgi:hypothetical protein
MTPSSPGNSAGFHGFTPALAALIHAKMEGSPLFMADLVRDLRNRQVIAEQQSGERAGLRV